MNREFRITSTEDGVRLDAFLADRLSLTRSRVKTLIDEGHVRVADKTAKPSLRVKKGMHVEGEIPEEAPLTLEPEVIPLSILYEDAYLLAVDKPAGMVVHPAFGHGRGTLVNAVLAHLEEQAQGTRFQDQGGDSHQSTPEPHPLPLAPCPLHLEPGALHCAPPSVRPGIVHRLDKGTTGVILVAKDWKTQEMLSSLFKKREMEKVYRALVEGEMGQHGGLVEGAIGRHPVDRKKMAVLKMGGREASTAFRVIERLRGYTYVEAYPKTGRTHQIRVHLAHAGHPVVGDDLYGRRARLLEARPLLHAWRLRFTHPVTGIPLSLEAPVPEDMTRFLEKNRGS